MGSSTKGHGSERKVSSDLDHVFLGYVLSTISALLVLILGKCRGIHSVAGLGNACRDRTGRAMGRLSSRHSEIASGTLESLSQSPKILYRQNSFQTPIIKPRLSTPSQCLALRLLPSQLLFFQFQSPNPCPHFQPELSSYPLPVLCGFVSSGGIIGVGCFRNCFFRTACSVSYLQYSWSLFTSCPVDQSEFVQCDCYVGTN